MNLMHLLMKGSLFFLICGGVLPQYLWADESTADPVIFENMAESGGVEFVLQNYITEEKHMIETMTGGVATLDYNNDGLLDIYFTNGAPTPSMKKDDPRFYNRLYRNDGDMKFTDAS